MLRPKIAYAPKQARCPGIVLLLLIFPIVKFDAKIVKRSSFDIFLNNYLFIIFGKQKDFEFVIN